MKIIDREFEGDASGETAVTELGALAREREKTKRVLIGAACLFVIVAALVSTFSPVEKEKVAYSIGIALVVMAIGAIGAAQFSLRLPSGFRIDTREAKRQRRAADDMKIAAK